MSEPFDFKMVVYLLCKEHGLKPEVVAQYCIADIVKEAGAESVFMADGGQKLEAAREYIESEDLVRKIKAFEENENRA